VEHSSSGHSFLSLMSTYLPNYIIEYYPLITVCFLLFIAILLFSFSKLRMDIIALLTIAAITVTGVLTPAEALSGFSDPNIILIALLFVIGESLVRTGISYKMSEYILKAAGKNESLTK